MGRRVKSTNGRSMRCIAVTNQKGGSGKTTTAVNLAAALGEAGRKVLVVDLDPQASASSWFGVKEEGRGLVEVLLDGKNLQDLVQATNAPGVDLVPASPWLLGLEKTLSSEIGAELLLRQALERVEQKRWDFVLMDCPPSLGLISLLALTACNEVFVPVEAHVMALAGLAGLTQTVTRVRERLNPEAHISSILPCRVNPRTNLSRDVVNSLRDRFGDLVLQSTVRESVRLAEAPSFTRPITMYASSSTGAADYRAVAAELLAREKRKQ